MEVERAAADVAAPRHRHPGVALAGQQGAEHIDRGPHAVHELVGRLGVELAGDVDLHDVTDEVHGRPDVAEHLVLHIGQDFREMLVLVMMRVHVDDQHVVEVASMRLLAGIGEKAAGVQLLDRYAPAAISDEFHAGLLRSSKSFLSGRSSSATCRARTRRDWRSAAARSP